MTRKSSPFGDGYLEARITSVTKFANFAVKNFVGPEFVFRGQANGDVWSLQPTFQRLSPDLVGSTDDQQAHLRVFRHAARGLRGHNPRNLTDDEWWALGQHYGLATPLLDWTRSYWVALYFAFSDSQTESRTRAVYSLDLSALGAEGATRSREVQVIDPESHDNPRLTSQSGLLLKLSSADSLEDWVMENFRADDRVVLAKIAIPNDERDYCLRDLNRMNISHLSLFPDLGGAAVYANTVFRVGGMVD